MLRVAMEKCDNPSDVGYGCNAIVLKSQYFYMMCQPGNMDGSNLLKTVFTKMV